MKLPVVAMGGMTYGPAHGGAFAYVTVFRCWSGEGSVIGSHRPAPFVAAKEEARTFKQKGVGTNTQAVQSAHCGSLVTRN